MPFRRQGMQTPGAKPAVAARKMAYDQVWRMIMDEAGRCRIEHLQKLDWDRGGLLFLSTIDVFGKALYISTAIRSETNR